MSLKRHLHVEALTAKNIRIARPGNDLPLRFYKYLIRNVAQKDFKVVCPIEW